MGKKKNVKKEFVFTPEREKELLDKYFNAVSEELDLIKTDILLTTIDMIVAYGIKPQVKDKVFPIYRTLFGYIHGFDINDKGKVVVISRDGINEQKQLLEKMTIEEMKAFTYFLYYNFVKENDSLA